MTLTRGWLTFHFAGQSLAHCQIEEETGIVHVVPAETRSRDSGVGREMLPVPFDLAQQMGRTRRNRHPPQARQNARTKPPNSWRQN
jgi:Lhr-like helicase